MENTFVNCYIYWNSCIVYLLLWFEKAPSFTHNPFELFWPLSAVMIDWIIMGNPLSIPQLSGAVILLASMTILTQERSNERS